MTRPLVLSLAAERDVAKAYRWYKKRSPGRALYFLKSFEDALSSIERNPDPYALVYRSARRVPLHGFPCGIFYIVRTDVVDVIGCVHSRRHSSRWRSRM